MIQYRRFRVTEDHLKLLRAAYVGWDHSEFGAPAIDCKRPYGKSNVHDDIAETLGIEPSGEDDFLPFTPEEIEMMDRLHKETKTVLQIALRVGEFKAGEYEAEIYTQDWHPVANERECEPANEEGLEDGATEGIVESDVHMTQDELEESRAHAGRHLQFHCPLVVGGDAEALSAHEPFGAPDAPRGQVYDLADPTDLKRLKRLPFVELRYVNYETWPLDVRQGGEPCP